MFNVLLDRLPHHWHGYRIDTDFRIGIQIMQCMSDEEFSEEDRICHAIGLLFPEGRPDIREAVEGVTWFLSEFSHDRHEGSSGTGNVKAYDFDIDQWRIYSAFKRQYDIDLNTARMHWFTFMGLLSNLDECAFTRVMDIRLKKIDPKSSAKEKKSLQKLKNVYGLENGEELLTLAEKQAQQRQVELFNSFLKSAKE